MKEASDQGFATRNLEAVPELGRTAAQWRATFDAVPHQVMVLDRTFRIEQANAATSAFFGLPAAELVGRFCHVLMHGTDTCIDGCPVTKALSTKAHAESEVGNPDVICYVEEWPTAEELEAEIRSDRFSRLLALMETAAEPPALEFRFVEETRGLDYIEAVRVESGKPIGD